MVALWRRPVAGSWVEVVAARIAPEPATAGPLPSSRPSPSRPRSASSSPARRRLGRSSAPPSSRYANTSRERHPALPRRRHDSRRAHPARARRHRLSCFAHDRAAPRRYHHRMEAAHDGVVRELAVIPTSQQGAVVSRLKVMERLDIAERRAPQDGRVAVKAGIHSVDLRMAVLPTKFGEKVTLRVLNQAAAPGSLADLLTCVADRQRKDPDALRGPPGAEHARPHADDDRGSRRVRDPGDRSDRGERPRRADLRARPAHPSSAPIRTRSSSGRFATRRPRRSPCGRR